ncbi:MAG: clostripain-related cysteine peptidase [Coriobacteriia bacterium]|nr:clostripain-related cysteine peptidase [Coriobacteriia bacterium]
MKRTRNVFRLYNSHLVGRILGIVLATVLAVSLFGSAACLKIVTDDPNFNPNQPNNPTIDLGDAPYEPYTAKDGTWAIYWYICGSDLELRDDLRFTPTGQMLEMMSVNLPSNVTVVVEAGGAKRWHNDFTDPNAINRFLYKGNTLTPLEKQPLANMGDPETLADFLTFCNQNYPAEKQMLLIYDHGGGSLLGVAFDDLYGMDGITLTELKQAVSSRPAASGAYELIGLSACLMATIDTVDALNGLARYFVASEESQLGCSWDYAALFSALARNSSINGAALGKAIADGYAAQCAQIGYTCYTTLSVIDMSYADDLLKAYNDVGIELLEGAVKDGAEHMAIFGRAAYASENYGGSNGSESKYDMVDLGDLVTHARELLPKSSAAMLRAINNAVVYHVINPVRSEGHGISCYFPYTGSARYFATFVELNTSPAFRFYYEYAFNGTLSQEGLAYLTSLTAPTPTPQPAPTPQPLPAPATLGLDDVSLVAHGNEVWWMELEERAENVAAIFLKVGVFNLYSGEFIHFGTRGDIYADWEYGLFYDEFSGYWGSIDGALCYMEAVGHGVDFVLYRVPVYHNGAQKNLMVLYSWSGPYYYEGSYEMLGLIALGNFVFNELTVSNPVYEPLKIGDIIEPILYNYRNTGDWDFNVSDPEELTSVSVTVDNETSFYNSSLGDGFYVIAFEMIDYSGVRHYSKPGYYVIYNEIFETFSF